MAELTLTQALSSALGAAVPNEARQALLAAVLGRPLAAQAERDAAVIPLPPRPQAPASVSGRPAAA